MSNQLKLLIYIVFVVAIFFFVQTKFHIFNISVIDPNKTSTEENNDVQSGNTASIDAEVGNSVEIITGGNTSVKINVELAQTATEKSTGLSFRKYLGDYDGMLFVYDSEVTTPFWMKDMQMPLDMIFLDDQNFVVDIKGSQAPCTATYCPSIYSSQPYKYVLEVNSGFCERNSITIGNSMVLYLKSVN